MQKLSAFIETILHSFIKGLPLAVLVLIGAFIVRTILKRGMDLIARRIHLTEADLLPLTKVFNSVLYVATAILVLAMFGVNMVGLWAVFSTILAMVGIGFVAVWSLLSNFSCAVLILFYRPFSIGDEIEFCGEAVKGKVVDLNFLYITLKTEDDALIQVPNNMFFQKSFKRRPNAETISLAQQLKRPQAAEVV